MDEEERNKIREIVGQMDCPKGFKCVEPGFQVLCRAKDIGLETFLECLEEDHLRCPFLVSFGDALLCECPLRRYIARSLGR